MAKIGHLEAVKIQARAVIPIAHALENEIGTERAHALIGNAIAESWADYVSSRGPEETHPRSTGEMGYPVDRSVVTDTGDEYAVNMTRCAFAEYFRSIGEPEIGALLTCGVDFAVTRRTSPGWTLTRTQTLMMGADHCDFCWKRNTASEE